MKYQKICLAFFIVIPLVSFAKNQRETEAGCDRCQSETLLPPSKLAPLAAELNMPAGCKLVGQGEASHYKTGEVTAWGEKFEPMGLTAAHRTLPRGTELLVRRKIFTSKGTSVRQIYLTVNDRGPYVLKKEARGKFGPKDITKAPEEDYSRIIDLSLGSAVALGVVGVGTPQVELFICGQKSSQQASRQSVQQQSNRPSPTRKPPVASAKGEVY